MSDETNPQLQIEVDVAANTAGAQEATSALNQVKGAAQGTAAATEDATSATDKMGRGAIGAAHTLHGLEQAAHGSARGLFTAARGMKELLASAGLAALNPILMLAAGIGIAVGLIVKHFEKAKEAAQKLGEEHAKLAEKAREFGETRFDNAIASYERIVSEIKQATAEQEKLNEARSKLKSAEVQARLAANELDEQKELAKLAPGDAEGRKGVTAKYARQRAGIEAAGAAEEASAKVEDAKLKISGTKQEYAAQQQVVSEAKVALETDREYRDAITAKAKRLEEIAAQIADETSASHIIGERGQHLANIKKLKQEQENLEPEVKAYDADKQDEKIAARRKKLDDEQKKLRGLDALQSANIYELQAAETHQTATQTKARGTELKGSNEAGVCLMM